WRRCSPRKARPPRRRPPPWRPRARAPGCLANWVWSWAVFGPLIPRRQVLTRSVDRGRSRGRRRDGGQRRRRDVELLLLVGDVEMKPVQDVHAQDHVGQADLAFFWAPA